MMSEGGAPITVHRLYACWLVRTTWCALPISPLESSAARKPSTG